jgi:hypothetical protein
MERMRGGAARDGEDGMEPPDQFQWLAHDGEYSDVEDDEHNLNAHDDDERELDAVEDELDPAGAHVAEAFVDHPAHAPPPAQVPPDPEGQPPGAAHVQPPLQGAQQQQGAGQPENPEVPGMLFQHHEFPKSVLLLRADLSTHKLPLDHLFQTCLAGAHICANLHHQNFLYELRSCVRQG